MNDVKTREVAAPPRQPRSVLIDMADRYGMEPQAFELTVRATCSPTGRDARPLTREEFAAFLLVAKEYKLNPITREVYAFPKRGGGVVPIVSIDGWVTLVNTHGSFDGVEFDMHHDDKGQLLACTCRIYRKDRGRPVEITEYFSECARDTDPWKMRHRMLRHKAMIQCARYAFGFSGIYDEDEGEKIADMRNVPSERVDRPTPPRSLAGKLDALGLGFENGSAPAGDSPGSQQAADGAGDVAAASPASELSEASDQPAAEHVDPETGEVTQGASVTQGEAEIITADQAFAAVRAELVAALAGCKTRLQVLAAMDKVKAGEAFAAFLGEQAEDLRTIAAERIADIQAAAKPAK